jgi:hypothetical protein
MTPSTEKLTEGPFEIVGPGRDHSRGAAAGCDLQRRPSYRSRPSDPLLERLSVTVRPSAHETATKLGGRPMTGSEPLHDNAGAPQSTDQLLAELDFPVVRWREQHRLLQAHIAAALDPWLVYLGDARSMGGEGHGERERAFAIVSLLSRSFTDLIAALHLTMHAYLNQAYSVLRATLEAFDLIELVGQHPEEGYRWVNTTQAYRDFRPADVRERLGKPRSDDLYNVISELGPHPRLVSSRLTGYMSVPVVKDADTKKRVHLRLGPFDAEQPDLFLVLVLVVQQVSGLGIKMLWLTDVSPDVSEEDWAEALLVSAEELLAAARVLDDELERVGVDGPTNVAEHYEKLRDMALKHLEDGSNTDA